MNLRRRARGHDDERTGPAHGATCPHSTLIARWDAAEDMGHQDRISGYRCDACAQVFSAAEGAELRRTEAARLTKTVG